MRRPLPFLVHFLPFFFWSSQLHQFGSLSLSLLLSSPFRKEEANCEMNEEEEGGVQRAGDLFVGAWQYYGIHDANGCLDD